MWVRTRGAYHTRAASRPQTVSLVNRIPPPRRRARPTRSGCQDRISRIVIDVYLRRPRRKGRHTVSTVVVEHTSQILHSQSQFRTLYLAVVWLRLCATEEFALLTPRWCAPLTEVVCSAHSRDIESSVLGIAAPMKISAMQPHPQSGIRSQEPSRVHRVRLRAQQVDHRSEVLGRTGAPEAGH